jgi:pimeloyl-ACP methyl ester carboxylesterase
MSGVTRRAALAAGAALSTAATGAAAAGAADAYQHRFVVRDGVKLHVAERGRGAPVLFVHGFPDFWWTWREQMAALAPTHRVAAMDQRGYNLSDKPAGDAAYAMPQLIADVAAVIDSLGGRVALVGHDWGGAVCWQVAARLPDKVERLAILNLPHPNGLARELASSQAQRDASAYAQTFKTPGAAATLTPERLAGWVRPEDRPTYVEAFRRSNIDAMLAYYRANYPGPPYSGQPGLTIPIRCRTQVIHGLADTALLAPALAGTWDWVQAPLDILTIPGAGHFVQRDAGAGRLAGRAADQPGLTVPPRRAEGDSPEREGGAAVRRPRFAGAADQACGS